MPAYDAPLLGFTEVGIERPDGTRLRTVVAGEGPRTAVLAHGFGYTAEEWNLVAPALLDRGFRVIAFDQRGHGASTIGSDDVTSRAMTDDYVAVLEGHDTQDAILVGHSMGGFLAIKFLLDAAPDVRARVKACLLMATFAGDANRGNLQNRVQAPLLRSGLLSWLLPFGPFAWAFARSLAGEPFDDGIVEPFTRILLEQDLPRLTPILDACVAENYYSRLDEIDLSRVTIIVGSRDRTTPMFHTHDLHKGISGSRLVVLSDKGHLLNWEAPEAIVDEIEKLAGATWAKEDSAILKMHHTVGYVPFVGVLGQWATWLLRVCVSFVAKKSD